MEKRQLQRMTIFDIREMMDNMNTPQSDMFYISKDFGISTGLNEIFRSVMHNDVPFLIDDCRFGVILKGEIDLTVNLINYKFTPGMMAYVGRGSIVQVNSVSDDANIQGIVLGDDFLKMALHGRMPRSFSGQELNFCQQVLPEDTDVISRIIQTTWAVVNRKDYNVETVYGLVAAMVHYFDWVRQRSTDKNDKPHSRERELFERFIMLVNANCNIERSLSYYAERMFLSERYLGTVIRQASGYTAKEWIDRAVITSAKVMLHHTDLQVAQISDRLNFANDSFFCKYFKRLTGMTPMDYRKDMWCSLV